MCALLAPAVAHASPNAPDPAKVRARIAKHGVGSWIWIEEVNGVALYGRVVNIDPASVGLQLANYPEVTPVLYTDIARVRTGISKGAFWTILGVGVGTVAVMAAVGIHEVHQNQIHSIPASLP
jgi:hypothetical protein